MRLPNEMIVSARGRLQEHHVQFQFQRKITNNENENKTKRNENALQYGTIRITSHFGNLYVHLHQAYKESTTEVCRKR